MLDNERVIAIVAQCVPVCTILPSLKKGNVLAFIQNRIGAIRDK